MPPGASLFSNPKLSWVQTNIVINHNQFFRRNLIIIHYRSNAFSAEIHKSLRLNQQHLLALNHAFSAKTTMFPLTDINIILVCQPINHRKAHIVSCIFIFFGRISKPCYDIHLLVLSFLCHSNNTPKALVSF